MQAPCYYKMFCAKRSREITGSPSSFAYSVIIKVYMGIKGKKSIKSTHLSFCLNNLCFDGVWRGFKAISVIFSFSVLIHKVRHSSDGTLQMDRRNPVINSPQRIRSIALGFRQEQRSDALTEAFLPLLKTFARSNFSLQTSSLFQTLGSMGRAKTRAREKMRED